jgi:hypothetical protein
MPRSHTLPRWPTIVIAAVVLCPGPRTHGRQPAAAGQPNAQREEYLGASYCSACHTRPQRPAFTDDYVLLTEYEKWKSEDKHSRAFEILKEPRAVQMGKILNIADVTRDAQCLNCHAANVPVELRAKDSFKIEDGVSCDACHGPSSRWMVPHSQKQWRREPMEAKEKLGMIDVRDPVKRARMCFSCHVGDAPEAKEAGKVVTHAMYAAGHPPLPGIEVATFSHQMPRHWRYIKQKDEAIQKLLAEFQKVDLRELEQSKLVIVSSPVALRQALGLLASHAEKEARSWPELSQFDCYACHHDLKAPSWRQQRGYMITPGRPQMRPWPTALVRAGLRYLGRAGTELDEQLKALNDAFNVQPFGKPPDLAAAAKKVAAWAGMLIGELESKKCYEDAARSYLKELCRLKPEEYPDYDSARQIAWAIEVVYGELPANPATDEAIRGLLAAQRKTLLLELPSGTGRNITKELPQSLAAIRDYDPRVFRAQLVDLEKLLNK